MDARALTRYIPTLDGWRAIAIIAVMASHVWPRVPVVGSGWLGVDLFFAISGFLITVRMLDEMRVDGRLSLTGFYLRRTVRIFPAYVTYLVCLAALTSWAGVPASRAEIGWSAIFLRNYAILPDGAYTNHFWSLAVEEHFYLLWPLLVVMLRPRTLLVVTPLLATAVHVWRGLDAHWALLPDVIPNLGTQLRTDTRIDAILWGCFAGLLRDRRVLTVAPGWATWGVLAGIITAVALAAPMLMLWMALLFPCLVLSTVLAPASPLSRALEWPPLRWIGRLSYSLYIWQTLFLQHATTPDPAWLRALKDGPWALACVFACACVSHYLIETPARRLGQRLSMR